MCPSFSSRASRLTLIFAVWLFSTTPVMAALTLLGGVFDGSEPAVVSLSGYEPCQYPLSYQRTAFQVSADGSYDLMDALDNVWGFGAIGFYARVYQGQFNPAAPQQNALTPRDYWLYTLKSGVNYDLVVQQGCESREGTWSIWFDGPGSVSSSRVLTVPQYFAGSFKSSDPTMKSICGPTTKTPYQQTGPIRVSRDGYYYFSDSSMKWSVSVCLLVYTAQVFPGLPEANLAGYMLYGRNRIYLQSGTDYYFVTQSIGGQKTGDYLFVLAPPAPFRINSGLAGAWFNPETPGQGFFLAVFEKINRVFLSWFTYANGTASSTEGDQRWLTALGPFEGRSANLLLEWTSGGEFNSSEPVPDQYQDGNIELEFSDCASGELRYNWGESAGAEPAASGVIPIQRLTSDALYLCETLIAGPGLPGPL